MRFISVYNTHTFLFYYSLQLTDILIFVIWLLDGQGVLVEAVVLMVGCLANDALNLRHSGQSGWSPLMDSVGGGVIIAGAIVSFEGESVRVCSCMFLFVHCYCKGTGVGLVTVLVSDVCWCGCMPI